ncbi:hypothetical protein [Metabacillus arenae]|nr:hypothetical protein [Metabacillus arenae]
MSEGNMSTGLWVVEQDTKTIEKNRALVPSATSTRRAEMKVVL